MLARAIDSSYGGMNLTALKSIRKVEPLQSYERGFFVSHTTVQRSQNELEKYMAQFIPIRHYYDSRFGAEVATFDHKELLAFIIKHHGLHEHALAGSIEIAVTADGASLGNGQGHVTIGYKVVDKRATIPHDIQTTGDASGFQSVNMCYPIRSVIGKETKELFRTLFHDIYSFLTEISQIGFDDYKRISVVGPHDGKATITVLSRGGGAKMTPNFCPYCTCLSEQLCTVVTPKCSGCSTDKHDLCRHWEVTDTNTINSAKEILASIRPDFVNLDQPVYFQTPEFIEIARRNEIITMEIPHSSTDPNHIDFHYNLPSVDKATRDTFARKVKEHIRVRQKHGRLSECEIRRSGSLLDMVTQLKAEMAMEEHVLKLRLMLEIDEDTKDERLLPVECMIPDSMHLLNRTTERIIKVLLMKGATHYIYRLERPLHEFKESVAKVVNSKKFRKYKSSDDDEEDEIDDTFTVGKSWTFPDGKDSTELVGDVKMSYATSKKFLKKVHLLYRVCLPPGCEKGVEMKTAIRRYQEISEILQQRVDLTDEKIDELSSIIQKFGDEWIDLAGEPGMTNYFHYLIAGHVVHYLKKYWNFYRFQQQGWEALNSWIKTYFLHHSQRGGHGSEKQNYLLPIYRHFQRSFGWRTGVANDLLDSKGKGTSFAQESEGISSDDGDVIEAVALCMQQA